MSDLMKDSGYKWVGDIPVSWDTKRIKYIATLKGRIGWQGLTSDEYQEEGACLITGTDFVNGKINWDSCVHVPLNRWEEASEIQIEDGDLLITKDGTVGKVAIVSEMTEKTSLNSGVLRIIPKKEYDKKYLFWVLQSNVFWNWFNYKNAGNSTILHLYQNDFNEFIYAFPDLKEQQAIAKFLDKRCKQIDEIINDLGLQIKKLEDYKVSLINECVTKGIRNNTRFKDSKVSWIGDIPEKWNVMRVLKTLRMPITDGPHVTPELQDSGIPFVSAEAVSTGNGRINFENFWGYISIDFYNECCRKYKPEVNDVYMIKSGATTGKVAILDKEIVFNIWSPLAVFRANDKVIHPYFLFYSLQANFFQMQVQLGWTYGTQQNIGMRTLEHLKICVPPLDEQNEIVCYLNLKCSDIDIAISHKKNQLEIMKTYKSSLIYEYVTGKKRVKVGE